MSRSCNRKGFHRRANQRANCPGDKFQVKINKTNQEQSASVRKEWLIKTMLTLTYPAFLLIIGEMYRLSETKLTFTIKFVILLWSCVVLCVFFILLYRVLLNIKEK